MSEVRKKQLLLVNMEYAQDEINEPINIDILLDCFPQECFSVENTTVAYRDLDTLQSVNVKPFDVILISSKLSSFNELQILLDACKEKIVIVGGIIAIGASDALAIRYPDIVFCTGEGETNLNSLLQLAYIASDSHSFKQAIIDRNIPNICFFDRNENKVFYSERVVCNLSHCPEPKHKKFYEVIKRNGLVRMETSRGCPWNKCSFCIMPWKFCGETWRPFAYTKIESEIGFLVQSGATQILFTDEDFVGNFEHIVALCDIIEKIKLVHKAEVTFGGSTSVMTLWKLGNKLDYCLSKMQKAGINLIFIGIESGCKNQLLRYNKGVTVAMNEEVIKKLQQYKFEIDFGYILFDADTTMKELEENLNFIDRAGLRSSISRFAKRLRVTPHTVFFEEYTARGLITSELAIDDLSYEYTFCDSTIKLICFFVEKMDMLALNESYRLQAITRSTVKQEDRDLARDRLHKLRECSYIFLCECVKEYNEFGKLSYENILKLFHRCLTKGGVTVEECTKY